MIAVRHLLLACLIAVCSSSFAKGPQELPGQFDYYAVALSWSPSYCATRRDADQCGRGHGFVLHGLWPQFEAGYPESCSTEQLPSHVRGRYAAIYPSPKLIGHEWSKHGTCSGLDPAAYFELSAKLKNQLAIPAAYMQPSAPVRATPGGFAHAFKAVNPKLAADSVLPFCSAGGSFLREIHACFDKAGRSRTCSRGEIKRSSNSCRQETFLLQSVR